MSEQTTTLSPDQGRIFIRALGNIIRKRSAEKTRTESERSAALESALQAWRMPE